MDFYITSISFLSNEARLWSDGERIGHIVAVVGEVHLVAIPGGKAVMPASPTAMLLVAGNVAKI